MRLPVPILIVTIICAAALLAILPPDLSAAEDRAVHEARRPGAPIQFRVRRPLTYRPESADSGTTISRTFTSAEIHRRFDRTLNVTAVANGPTDARVADIFKLSKEERRLVADALVDELARSEGELTEIKSVKIVKVDDINGLKIDFESVSHSGNYPLLSRQELIYLPDAQNADDRLASATVTLRCRFSGSLEEHARLLRTYRSERRKVCQRFFDSYVVLDRWR
jgi:hypothetical protein